MRAPCVCVCVCVHERNFRVQRSENEPSARKSEEQRSKHTRTYIFLYRLFLVLRKEVLIKGIITTINPRNWHFTDDWSPQNRVQSADASAMKRLSTFWSTRCSFGTEHDNGRSVQYVRVLNMRLVCAHSGFRGQSREWHENCISTVPNHN
jgi:hypothetical protein